MKHEITSPQLMHQFGKELGTSLRGGEVIELVGDVGAGKTTLTKGIAEGMGIDEDVQSPSFTLSRVYEGSNGKRLLHYDFYRLSDPGILADELVGEVGQPDTVTIIEWAAIVEGVLPADRIRITITPQSETGRIVIVSGSAA